MNTEFQIKDPNQLEAVLTIRATVGEFRQMRVQAKTATGSWTWPIAGLIESLDQILEKSDERFQANRTEQ